jgi:hypothetical protein
LAVVQVCAQVEPAGVLAAGRIQMHEVIGQETIATVAEHPASARGVEVVGQRETEGRGHRGAPLRCTPHGSGRNIVAVQRHSASLVI